MKRTWNPAVLVGVAILALWFGTWLVGYLMDFSGDPSTFFGGSK